MTGSNFSTDFLVELKHRTAVHYSSTPFAQQLVAEHWLNHIIKHPGTAGPLSQCLNWSILNGFQCCQRTCTKHVNVRAARWWKRSNTNLINLLYSTLCAAKIPHPPKSSQLRCGPVFLHRPMEFRTAINAHVNLMGSLRVTASVISRVTLTMLLAGRCWKHLGAYNQFWGLKHEETFAFIVGCRRTRIKDDMTICAYRRNVYLIGVPSRWGETLPESL